MAKVTETVCDLDGSRVDVTQVRVKHGAEWEIDVCAKCYQSRFADLEKLGHRPIRRSRRVFTVTTPVG